MMVGIAKLQTAWPGARRNRYNTTSSWLIPSIVELTSLPITLTTINGLDVLIQDDSIGHEAATLGCRTQRKKDTVDSPYADTLYKASFDQPL
jgi:hypothetical protein